MASAKSLLHIISDLLHRVIDLAIGDTILFSVASSVGRLGVRDGAWNGTGSAGGLRDGPAFLGVPIIMGSSYVCGSGYATGESGWVCSVEKTESLPSRLWFATGFSRWFGTQGWT